MRVTIIQEAKDLDQLSFQELLGSLMTRKLTLMNQEQDDSNKRKKMLAFNPSNKEDSIKLKESGDEDKDPSLITKKFKSFLEMKKKKKEEGRKLQLWGI